MGSYPCVFVLLPCLCTSVCVLLPEQSVCNFVSTKQLHGTLGLVSNGELFGPREHCGPAPSLEWAHAGPMAATATSRITIRGLLRVPKNWETGPQTVAQTHACSGLIMSGSTALRVGRLISSCPTCGTNIITKNMCDTHRVVVKSEV